MKIAKFASIGTIQANWPHNVAVGAHCRVENGVTFKFDGPISDGIRISIDEFTFIGSGTEFNISEGISIGKDCLIASGCRFVDHNHGTETSVLMRKQASSGAPIVIGNDVWVGANCVVLAGVSIGDGAIVGAGAVLNRNVPSGEIWAGVPARQIGSRSTT